MVLAKFYNCACPCGCTKLTKSLRTDSEVLERRARCSSCSEPAHRKEYPNADTKESARVITPFIPFDDDDIAIDKKIAAEQQKQILAEAQKRWIESLPEKFRDAHADHPKVEERLRRWRTGSPGTAGLVILGSLGQGKTFMSLGYANAAINEGLVHPSQVLFGTEAELLSSAANSTFSEVDLALRRLINPRYKMVVIDDVGRGTWIRDDMRPKVFSLVFDAAYRDNRVLVITTNLVPKDLEEYIGEGAMDRLRSMVGYDALDLTDRGMREKVTRETIQRTKPKQP